MKIKRFKSEKGAVTVIVALSLVALMMVVALTIDVGSLYEERRHLQTVADSAALAGVFELPEDVDTARDKAIEYGLRHGVSIDPSDIEISSTLTTDDTITVNAVNPNAHLYFARVIGLSETRVVASSKALVGTPKELNGLVPWGVQDDDYDPGTEYVLKWGSGPAGGSMGGNFQCLALDGTGANEYEDNIIHGSDTYYHVGNIIESEPGNMVGPTRQGTNTRIESQHNFVFDTFDYLTEPVVEGFRLSVPDSQFIIIPIIPELVDVHGRLEVEILGFVPFIINGVHDMNNDPEYGNGIEITGTFINQAIVITEGGLDPAQICRPCYPGGIKAICLTKL